MTRAIVEFGRPKSAELEIKPVGVSGGFVCSSIKKANDLAVQLRHVSGNRPAVHYPELFMVSREHPRLVWWNHDSTWWIAVTILDVPGYLPGSFAAVADKEAAERLK